MNALAANTIVLVNNRYGKVIEVLEDGFVVCQLIGETRQDAWHPTQVEVVTVTND